MRQKPEISSAPHFSGVWKRLIREIKRAMKTILKNALVTEHVLRTMFCEVESRDR